MVQQLGDLRDPRDPQHEEPHGDAGGQRGARLDYALLCYAMLCYAMLYYDIRSSNLVYYYNALYCDILYYNI